MANSMEFFVNTVWGAWSQAHEGLVKAKTEELQADKKQLEAEFVGNWRKRPTCHQSLCHPTCAEFGRRKSVSKFGTPQNLSVYHHFSRYFLDTSISVCCQAKKEQKAAADLEKSQSKQVESWEIRV
jgi:hypothetical protein